MEKSKTPKQLKHRNSQTNMKINELPDVGTTTVIQEGNLIAFVNAELDECAVNPLKDCDCYGDIVSLCARHTSFNKRRFDDNEHDADCVVLGYFEHGSCDWHVTGHKPPGTEGDYRWDGVSRAGLWIPNASVKADLEAAGPVGSCARRALAFQRAGEAAKVFTAWCNGDIYYWSVKVYEALYTDGAYLLDQESDYRFSVEVRSESCGGYYLEDDQDEAHMLEDINAALA